MRGGGEYNFSEGNFPFSVKCSYSSYSYSMTSCSNYKALYRKDICKRKKCMWLNGPNWLNCLKFRSRSSTLSIPGCGCVSTCGALLVVPNLSRGLRGSSGSLDTSKRENTFAMKPRLREKDDWGFLMPPPPPSKLFYWRQARTCSGKY